MFEGSAGEGRCPWLLGVGLEMVNPAPWSCCSPSFINLKGVLIGAFGIQIFRFSVELLW